MAALEDTPQAGTTRQEDMVLVKMDMVPVKVDMVPIKELMQVLGTADIQPKTTIVCASSNDPALNELTRCRTRPRDAKYIATKLQPTLRRPHPR